MSNSVAGTEPHLEGLDDFYRREIEPWLKAREAQRTEAIRRRWLIIGGGLAVAAIVALLLLVSGVHLLWLLLPAAIAVAAVVFGVRATSRLRREIKEFLANKLAAFFGFTYHADPTADPVERFRGLGLVPGHDRCRMEDEWSGSAAGVTFSMVEAKLEDRRTTRDGKGQSETTYETVFQGLLLSLACPHPFKGAIMIRRDLGKVFNWFREKFSARDPVEFDDADFEAQFEVFADDAAEARRLLDPSLRRRILALAGDQSLTMAFHAGEVLLAIKSADRFELSSLGRTLVDPERVRRMAADVGIVFDVVECLNLRPGDTAR